MPLNDKTLLEKHAQSGRIDSSDFSVLLRNHVKFTMWDSWSDLDTAIGRFASAVGVGAEDVRTAIDGGEPSAALLDALGLEIAYTGMYYRPKRLVDKDQ
jgi:hypothetical protein